LSKKTRLPRDDVQLVFGRTSGGEFESAGAPSIKEFAASLKDLHEWFSGFRIAEIELSIEGGLKDSGVTKLFISFEGKAGCKVTLKPDGR
jgi:hypothetical protein